MTRPRKRVGAAAKILLVAIAWGAFSFSSARAQTPPTTIMWNGIQWNVKSGTKKPGPNNWSPSNAFVDANGDLHLSITNVGGAWYCSEVWTNATFGFGSFQWQVSTAVDNLDPNVVLGLFAYGPPALGPDGTNEIDIEYSRFGAATGNNGRWTTWPTAITTPPVLGRTAFPLSLGADPTTTSSFTWSSSQVVFGTFSGFQAPDSSANPLQSWSYQPTVPSAAIAQAPMPIHMNLYLYQGSAPTNGQGVDVTIHSFSFTPSAATVPALPGTRALIMAACLIVGVGLVLLGRFPPSRA
jgi:hypothetical protein